MVRNVRWYNCTCTIAHGHWAYLTYISNSLSTMVRNVRWLGEEALKRYLKLRPPSFVPNREEVSFTTLSYFVSLNIS